MTPQRRKTTYKLSPIQEGMLFDDASAKTDIEQIVCTLDEQLDIETLKSAWRLVVDRHEAMRTCFYSKDSKDPQQNIHRDVVLPWNTRDLRGLSEAQQDSEFKGWLREDSLTAFELDSAPLMRFNLFRLGDKKWTLAWTFHRGILDSRSIHIVLSEVFRTYDAELRSETLELQTVRPFSDYIEFLYTLDISQAEKYWRKTLRGVTGTTRLRALAGKGGEEGYGEQELQLSAEVTKALNELAVRERFTINNAVQAAWALALGRYNDTDDVVFGAARPCRGFLPRAGSMVGKFGNTLPLRVKMDGGLSVSELLRQIRVNEIALRDFEHTSLARILSWSDLRPSRQLFQSVVVFDNAPLNTQLKSPYLNWANRNVQVRENANCPITLYAYAEPALTLRLAYDRRRFGQAKIQQALLHLATILGEIATGAEKTAADLQKLIPPQERPQAEVRIAMDTVAAPAVQIEKPVEVTAPAPVAASMPTRFPAAAVAAVPGPLAVAMAFPIVNVLAPVFPDVTVTAQIAPAPVAPTVAAASFAAPAPAPVAPSVKAPAPVAAVAAVPAAPVKIAPAAATLRPVFPAPVAPASVIAALVIPAAVAPAAVAPVVDVKTEEKTTPVEVKSATDNPPADQVLWNFVAEKLPATKGSSMPDPVVSPSPKPTLLVESSRPSGPFAWATEEPAESQKSARAEKSSRKRVKPSQVLGNLLQSAKSVASTVSVKNCLAAPSALRELLTNDTEPDHSTDNSNATLGLRDPRVELRGQTSLITIQPNGNKAPIFCISGLDGDLNVFRTLSAGLGTNQPVYAVDASGLQNDPSIQTSVKKLARYYIEQLRRVGQNQPYCLMGESFGGLVALEMSQQLWASGIEVAGTVLINTHYPAGCRTNEKLNARMQRYTRPLRKALKRDAAQPEDGGESLYSAELAASTQTSEISKIEQSAADRYRTRPYSGRACVLKASTPLPAFDGGPKAGWDRIFSDGLSIYYEIPGDRGVINTAKHAGLMVRRVNEFLGGVEEARVVPVFTRIAS